LLALTAGLLGIAEPSADAASEPIQSGAPIAVIKAPTAG